MAVVIVYLGFLVMLAGLVSLVKPLTFLGIKNRRRAGIVLGAGLVVSIIGALLPADLESCPGRRTRIDAVMPTYHFHEVHSREVDASPARIFSAVKAVTPRDIRFLRTLFAIRSLGAERLPEARPMLETMNDWGYLTLVEEEGREIVLGFIGSVAGEPAAKISDPQRFREFDEPGYVKVAFNFHLERGGSDGIEVTTQTRVLGTDAGARREFAAYWRVIYPWSSLIRVMWLEATEDRAEGRLAAAAG